MADNSAKIAKLQALLESGARQISIAGNQATIDPDSIRSEIRRLQGTDDANVGRRPVAASINLGGAT